MSNRYRDTTKLIKPLYHSRTMYPAFKVAIYYHETKSRHHVLTATYIYCVYAHNVPVSSVNFTFLYEVFYNALAWSSSFLCIQYNTLHRWSQLHLLFIRVYLTLTTRMGLLPLSSVTGVSLSPGGLFSCL